MATVAFGYLRRTAARSPICARDFGVSLDDPLWNSTRSRSTFIDPLPEEARYLERRSSILPAGKPEFGRSGKPGDVDRVAVPAVPTAFGAVFSTFACRGSSWCR